LGFVKTFFFLVVVAVLEFVRVEVGVLEFVVVGVVAEVLFDLTGVFPLVSPEPPLMILF